ncbi:hypothetical protein [Pseudochrobactrum sp. HB0163]|uniref:hypothetical protein n=1 Tax=Pseudochrobactrum sp. HB0163 TaxID=3450708 RepID=UPI003F6DB84A
MKSRSVHSVLARLHEKETASQTGALNINTETCPSDSAVKSRMAERLGVIAAELNLLFSGFAGDVSCLVRVDAANVPFLFIGEVLGLELSLEIAAESDQFVVCEKSGQAPSILITANEARVIDHIIGLVTSSGINLMPQKADQAVDALIGQSLADVEGRLVMRTLRYFRGNSVQAAFALGVSEAELIALMRRHLLDAPPVLFAKEGRQ